MRPTGADRLAAFTLTDAQKNRVHPGRQGGRTIRQFCVDAVTSVDEIKSTVCRPSPTAWTKAPFRPRLPQPISSTPPSLARRPWIRSRKPVAPSLHLVRTARLSGRSFGLLTVAPVRRLPHYVEPRRAHSGGRQPRWMLILLLLAMSASFLPTWCCATPRATPSSGPKRWRAT